MTPQLAEISEKRVSVTAFADYFRCPEEFGEPGSDRQVSAERGYFRFGESICFGRVAGRPVPTVNGSMPLVDAMPGADGSIKLPFDLSDVVANLREECYTQPASHHFLDRITGTAGARSLYYFMRPVLPVFVRKHLQKARLAGWPQITFPKWPVDVTVDTLMLQAMRLMLKNAEISRVPFIWFWPDGAPSCAVMTHDVEDTAGRDFCAELMDLDDAFGIKAAFQLVPETRGEMSNGFRNSIRKRGFEVNLHDLNHDGYLFDARPQFLARAAQINRYARDLQCGGFRSGSMYRQQCWFDALEFSYDMSVPNVAHLEPQRGGCCTVMPYFIGHILELPLTTIQDYSLFHILGQYSIALWKEQMRLIRDKHGLMMFIAHPDYLIERRARDVYVELLSYLSELRASGQTWIALPADVNQWWRQRRAMRLVQAGGAWRAEGEGSERARVAYARLHNDRVVYEFA